MRLRQSSCTSTLSAVSVGPAYDAYTHEGFTTEHHRQPPRLHSWTQSRHETTPPMHYTPSSSSTTPLPSSPPPLVHSKSPYATVALPSLLPNQEGELVVSPVLERGPAGPALHWDVRTSPMTAFESVDARPRRRHPTQDRHDHRRRNWTHQPATSPALGSIVIRTIAVADRPLVVFPTTANRAYVTVHDMLDAVHRAVLAENVALDDELLLSQKGNILGASADETRDPQRFASRAANSRGLGGWLWGGLTPSPTEAEVWILLLH